MLEAGLGLIVWGGEQGKEVVGRERKRKEIRKYGVGHAHFMVEVPWGHGCGQVRSSPAPIHR